LRELNLAYSSVADLRGLEKLIALETLDVTNISTTDLSILRQCPRLVTLTAQGDITALESIIHAAAPSLVDCRLHVDRPVRALDSRSLSCLRRCTVLKFSDLDNASLQELEEISSLEQLDLSHTRVDDVRSLAGCRALRELMLQGSVVTDVGIIVLERVATLEVLNLAYCEHITSVTSLRHCTALRELILVGTCVTDAGIAGLECIVTLTKLPVGKSTYPTFCCCWASARDPLLQVPALVHYNGVPSRLAGRASAAAISAVRPRAVRRPRLCRGRPPAAARADERGTHPSSQAAPIRRRWGAHGFGRAAPTFPLRCPRRPRRGRPRRRPGRRVDSHHRMATRNE
jgi:hypothetical protein